MARPFQVTMDAVDPARLAAFWAAALDYEVQPPPAGFASWEEFLRAQGVPREQWGAASAVVDPDGVRPRLFFQRVPEAKAVKNRVHLDLERRRAGGTGRGAAPSRPGGGRPAGGARGERGVRARRPRCRLGGHARPRGQRVLRLGGDG